MYISLKFIYFPCFNVKLRELKAEKEDSCQHVGLRGFAGEEHSSEWILLKKFNQAFQPSEAEIFILSETWFLFFLIVSHSFVIYLYHVSYSIVNKVSWTPQDGKHILWKITVHGEPMLLDSVHLIVSTDSDA